MNDSSKTIFGCFGLVVLIIVGIVTSAILNGYVLMKLWEWFIMPTFESAPALSIPVAIGVGLLVSLLTYHTTNNKSNDDSTTEGVVRFVLVVFHPLLYLVLGWIVYQFV